MMYKIRYMAGLILILAACSALTALKTNPNGIVGKIDNKSYTFSEYNSILTNYLSYWQSREGNLSSTRKKELNDQCWNELIGRSIYDNEIKRRGLVVSDQEAYNSVMANPPIQVKQIEALKTNGKFDQEKFKKAMEMDAKFKSSVLALVKETMIYDKLFNVIKGQAKAKPDSVKNVWFKDNNTFSAKVIYFDYNKMPEPAVADSEIATYYNTHKETYKKNPARKLKYVKFAASQYTKTKADSIYNALKNGADFAALAIQFSADPGSGKQGGDLGWFGKGRMVKPFEEAAFSLADSAISLPVESQFGWHIIQTLEHRKNEQGQDEVHARHILINADNDSYIKNQIQKDADAFMANVKTEGLQMAATLSNYPLRETVEFYENDKGIKDLGQYPELIKEAFANTVGHIPAMISAKNGDTFVCQVSDSLDFHYSPLENEKGNILPLVVKDKKILANKQVARDFYDKYLNQDYLTIAERDSMKIISGDDLKADGAFPEIGRVQVLNDAILAKKAGEFTGLVEDASNAFIAKVTQRKVPTNSEWDKQKGKVLAKANDDLKMSQLNNWYFQQRQKVKIEDNRKDFYDLPAPNNPMQQIRLQ